MKTLGKTDAWALGLAVTFGCKAGRGGTGRWKVPRNPTSDYPNGCDKGSYDAYKEADKPDTSLAPTAGVLVWSKQAQQENLWFGIVGIYVTVPAFAAFGTRLAFFFKRSDSKKPITVALSVFPHLLFCGVLVGTSIVLGSPGRSNGPADHGK
jgi:hypothetical protein